ncbi:hypothetical protein CLIB1423_15S01266 [[Candida] railenensis]|uniref:RNase H type-1 domain-containing protein n=1 Tax=[Candida] railenensis TaxID=45579 RepID=A0A9P0QTU9_9ASCO|nr:hypothetical protein CLIB1423_15S01266 [[Candida] railenensis]
MTDPIEIDIYVDGSSRHNGPLVDPYCGYGVYYGPDDKNNVGVAMSSIDLVDENIAPNGPRAELAAIRHALRDVLAFNSSSVKHTILSDSKSSVEAITVRSKKWVKNGWKSSNGAAVQNRDLIMECLQLHKEVNRNYRSNGWGPLYLFHVHGHKGVKGNMEADRLAILGADKDKLLRDEIENRSFTNGEKHLKELLEEEEVQGYNKIGWFSVLSFACFVYTLPMLERSKR